MYWFLKVLQNYAGFTGRARRKEYWMFLLIYLLITFALHTIEVLTGMAENYQQGWLVTIYSLALVIPSLAVMVRRLHDINRTGWWVLLGLIPLLGPLILLIFAVQEGDPSPNRYGPNPKERSV